MTELAEYYGVSLDYLAGRSPFKQELSVDREEQELLNNWRSLSERGKGKVEYLMDDLLEAQRKKKEVK